MAGGPVAPSSVYVGGASGNLFPNFYAGAGGNASPHDEGIGVVASLAADATVELRFPMPPSIPTGTLKLMCRALANATSGTAKFTVKDATVAGGASPSAATLTSETQSSVTWAAGDNDKYKDTKVTLSASPAANDTLVVAITFNTTGWTLAQILTMLVWVLWE
jgi:hypothetical protein